MKRSNKCFGVTIVPILLLLSFAISRAFASDVGFSEPIDVAFKARVDDSEQRYVLMLPTEFNPSNTHDLVIAFHGLGADRWQYVKQDRDETRAARDVSAKHAMIYISPDYRASTSWMGPKAEEYVVQIIKDTRHKYKIGRVFLVGASLGGSSALTFSALHPELISGVCSTNLMANYFEFTNFQDTIAESFGGTKTHIPLEYKKRSAEYWPEKFTFPVAITTGGKDEAVPPHSAIRLANVLKSTGACVLLINRDETGHSTNYDDAITAFEFVISNAKDTKK